VSEHVLPGYLTRKLSTIYTDVLLGLQIKEDANPLKRPSKSVPMRTTSSDSELELKEEQATSKAIRPSQNKNGKRNQIGIDLSR
jgi:hypothetical protein